jgi:hypothetical protein
MGRRWWLGSCKGVGNGFVDSLKVQHFAFFEEWRWSLCAIQCLNVT